MDNFEEFDATTGEYLSRFWDIVNANLIEFFQNSTVWIIIAPFVPALILGFIGLLISLAQSTDQNSSDLDDEDEESDDEYLFVGILERFDSMGQKLETKKVFSEEPEWDYDEDGNSVLGFISSKDGDDGEIEIESNTFAVFRSDLIDEECGRNEEWLVVVVVTPGRILFKEVVRGDERPDLSDNYARVWDCDGRQLSIYCGSDLVITAVRHKKTDEKFETAAN